jgi:hypothetical protein
MFMFLFLPETPLRERHFICPLMLGKFETHAPYPFEHGPVKLWASPGRLVPSGSLHLMSFEPKTSLNMD